MSASDSELEPTGERFIPEFMAGEMIDAEHQARYRFVLPFVDGRRILDAGCGVGWGSALLLDSGAAAVTGIDIDPLAVANAVARVPGASFQQADLLALPFADGSFDIVVCFEALEHTGDTEQTISELCRVLAPGGVLFVSSPNPEVYPSGNPFHLNEETPERLREVIGRKLAHLRVLRQHGGRSSLLFEDEADSQLGPEIRLHAVEPLSPDGAAYSLVVAGNGELPDGLGVAVFLSGDGVEPWRIQADYHATEIGRLNEVVTTLEADRLRLTDELDRAVLGGEAQLNAAVAARDRYAAMLLASEAEAGRNAALLATRERELEELAHQHGLAMSSAGWRTLERLRRARRSLR